MLGLAVLAVLAVLAASASARLDTSGAPGVHQGTVRGPGPDRERTCTVVGTPDDDTLRGTNGNDVLCGLEGDDVLLAGSGDDVLVGGSGNDELQGHAGADRLLPGTGDDLAFGGDGADTLIGGAGKDRVYGGPGDDVLRARDGQRDLADGGGGSDRGSLDAFDDLVSLERPAVSPLPSGPAPDVQDDGTVVAAVGDIACDPTDEDFNDGLGTASRCRHAYIADIVAEIEPAALLVLGDVQYEDGRYWKYLASYDRAFGRFRAITHPTPGGGHDQRGGGDYYQYFGALAGPSVGETWYSFDVGGWHVVSLNANCTYVGGCSRDSPQGEWLAADLAAYPTACTIAIWHNPRWSSGKWGDDPRTDGFVRILYEHGAELILSGHNHDYERIAPLDPEGNLDPERGLRQFVVGTGGRNHTSLVARRSYSEAYDAATYGVLELTLRSDGYSWRFVPDGVASFEDRGSGVCH